MRFGVVEQRVFQLDFQVGNGVAAVPDPLASLTDGLWPPLFSGQRNNNWKS
jgi:hypothetical protein